jgi:AraC family transcriptional regulator
MHISCRRVDTMSDAKENTYARRFNRVLDYIDKHLDDDISVDLLSTVANFSKFHFHRQFSEYCGVNVGRYILLMKLKRASHRLAFNHQDRIIDIAFDAGFENPESFSRAFKNAFGQTPTEFRKCPAWEAWSARYQFDIPTRQRTDPMEVRIVDAETIIIATLEHHGAPALLNESVSRFIAWRKTTGLSPIASSQSYGIVYNDPNTTPADDFRFDICGSVAEAVPANQHGIVTKKNSRRSLRRGPSSRIARPHRRERVLSVRSMASEERGRITRFSGLFSLSEFGSRHAGTRTSDRHLPAAEIK